MPVRASASRRCTRFATPPARRGEDWSWRTSSRTCSWTSGSGRRTAAATASATPATRPASAASAARLRAITRESGVIGRDLPAQHREPAAHREKSRGESGGGEHRHLPQARKGHESQRQVGKDAGHQRQHHRRPQAAQQARGVTPGRACVASRKSGCRSPPRRRRAGAEHERERCTWSNTSGRDGERRRTADRRATAPPDDRPQRAEGEPHQQQHRGQRAEADDVDLAAGLRRRRLGVQRHAGAQTATHRCARARRLPRVVQCVGVACARASGRPSARVSRLSTAHCASLSCRRPSRPSRARTRRLPRAAHHSGHRPSGSARPCRSGAGAATADRASRAPLAPAASERACVSDSLLVVSADDRSTGAARRRTCSIDRRRGGVLTGFEPPPPTPARVEVRARARLLPVGAPTSTTIWRAPFREERVPRCSTSGRALVGGQQRQQVVSRRGVAPEVPLLQPPPARRRARPRPRSARRAHQRRARLAPVRSAASRSASSSGACVCVRLTR